MNIHWYEYLFLALGIIAVLVTDGLTIVRMIDLGSLNDPDFAYGILILVHSGKFYVGNLKDAHLFLPSTTVFLLAFLVTGILFQRITDIIAFLISAVLLTTYVVAHYFARRNYVTDTRNTQPTLRLVS